jgi:hypothetical protein
MADFQVLPFDFASTEVKILAMTAAAKARIYGGVSVNVMKSAAPDFVDQLEAEGFRVEVI